MILVNPGRHSFQSGGQQGNEGCPHLVRMNDLGAALAQRRAITRELAQEARRIERQVRINEPARHGDVLNCLRMLRLVLKPQFSGDTPRVETLDHRHHKIPRTDWEMNGMDDLQHFNLAMLTGREGLSCRPRSGNKFRRNDPQ